MTTIEQERPATRTERDDMTTGLTGRIVEIEADVIYVSLGQRVHEATRAVSCLVAPVVGDEVGLLRAVNGRLFVTAVLVRPREMPLTLDAPHGLAVSSGGDIRLEAAHSMQLQGCEFSARFDQVHWMARLLYATGAEFVLRSKAARLFTQALEALCARMQVGADRSYRHIAEAEHVRVGMLDVRAKHLANVRAGTLVLTARELAKVDGAQIHVG